MQNHESSRMCNGLLNVHCNKVMGFIWDSVGFIWDSGSVLCQAERRRSRRDAPKA